MLLKCLKANQQVLCKAESAYIYLSATTDISRVLPQLFETKTIKTQVINHVGRLVHTACEKQVTHKANYPALERIAAAIQNRVAFSETLITLQGLMTVSSVTL
jgi:hypothetical protein